MDNRILDELQQLKGERIAKRIARAGICSRREAEKLIAEERVTVDGKTVMTPATMVTESSVIRVDGELIKKIDATRLWLFHKPRGVITTHNDPQGRETVFDLLPPDLPRVISVGRLDYNTEGLLLLTNDGELSRYLELPATGWIRRYKVRVFGRVRDSALERLKQGVTIDGVEYGSIEATLESSQGKNSWLMVSVREGKNREVRKVMDYCKLKVNRLIRVSYGPFQLGSLKEGETREVPQKMLNEQINLDKMRLEK